MTIVSIVLVILVLGIAPLLAGQGICYLLKLNRDICSCFVVGNISIWALCQIISIPFIICKASFLWVVILMTGCTLFIIALGLYLEKGKYKQLFNISVFFGDYRSLKRIETGAVILMLILLSVFITATVILQHIDADDSRFVVNAVDIIRTHRMFLTNPATGEYLGEWRGEVSRDVVSPWSVYVAYCSFVTMIHPTVVFHLILPVFLYITVFCTYWRLSGELVEDGVIYRCIFTLSLLMLSIYGYTSAYTAETFLITRLWQGKSVVVGLGVPLLITVYVKIFSESMRVGRFIFLVLVETALCLTSGMGIIIGALMAGSYGIAYAIIKKDFRIGLYLCLTAVPNVLCYAISVVFEGPW